MNAAYHGKGWKPRRGSFEGELALQRPPWSGLRNDSEFRRLKAVLLYCPGRELLQIRNTNAALHLQRIDPRKIAGDFRRLASAYRKLGIAVHFIDPNALAGVGSHWNLMYARDLFFNSRAGAVVARMASQVRSGEERYGAHALAELSIPIARTVGGRGVFEGADALWLDRHTVLCGVGARTNREGFLQLADHLRLQNVRCVAVPLPRDIQHLLGILQLVDRDLAVLRAEKAPPSLKALLKRRRFSVLEIPESDEVCLKQGMNIVTVRPRTIVMPADCDRLKKQYRAAGLTIAAEVAVPELLKGAGGIGCATGILAREVVGP